MKKCTGAHAVVFNQMKAQTSLGCCYVQVADIYSIESKVSAFYVFDTRRIHAILSTELRRSPSCTFSLIDREDLTALLVIGI